MIKAFPSQRRKLTVAASFDLKWLKDPEVFSVGLLPPCSDHDIFAGAAEADSGRSSLVQSLDGIWRAHFALRADEAPDSLIADGSGDAELMPVQIPGEFQIRNPAWDPPQYVNFQYPWDGHEDLVPPQVSDEYNPTVTCIRTFAVEAGKPEDCGRAVLTVGAVEAAAAVWLNGQFLGYGEDSFTPKRFDVTRAIRAGENRLVIRVFKRCTGSWLEDQDFWRFSGIHRSVTLTWEPKVHLEDLFVRTPLEEDYTRAFLEVDLKVDRPEGTAAITLTDRQGCTLLEKEVPCAEEISFRDEVPGVSLWSAEDPVLYTLRVTLKDQAGNVAEVAQAEIGFRQFEMKDRIMCLNGKRIVFHGVNRHEFDCDEGRVMTEALLLRDLTDMKAMNVNAIRTCHYPNTGLLYRLCDRYGFYVIDETNIETHGTWSRPDPDERAVPASDPRWREAVLARGRAMQERDKNHPCVLLWSCGNESWYGENLLALSRQFKRRDPTRLVHYEGCWLSEEYGHTSDVYSRMYLKAADIEAYLRGDPDRPMINCEYSHAMGNSCGGLSLYRDLEDRWPMYQGGFIWDYVDQGLRQKLPDGGTRLSYGGDWGDRPTDWQFNTNGIILGDRTLTPKVQEVRACFAEVTLTPDEQGVTVRNRRVFAPLRGMDLRWSVLLNRMPYAEGVMSLPEIPAGAAEYVPLPLEEVPFGTGEALITVELCVAEHPLLPRGTVLAFGQSCVGEMPEAPEAKALPLIATDFNIGVRELGAMINRQDGLIALRDAAGRETLLATPLLSLFRASTDNDRGNGLALRQGIWHLVSRYAAMKPEDVKGGVIRWKYRCDAVPGLDLTLSLTPTDGGLNCELTWKGIAGLPELPALGLSFRMDPRLHHVRYFGLGPEESYIDRCEGARLGWHGFDSNGALTRYCKPQECGNRRGVSLLRLTDDDGHGVEIEGANLEISVLPYLPEELMAARHPEELKPGVKTVLDIAAFRMGIGGDDSWGAPVLPQFTYPSDRDYTLRFTLRGI